VADHHFEIIWRELFERKDPEKGLEVSFALRRLAKNPSPLSPLDAASI